MAQRNFSDDEQAKLLSQYGQVPRESSLQWLRKRGLTYAWVKRVRDKFSKRRVRQKVKKGRGGRKAREARAGVNTRGDVVHYLRAKRAMIDEVIRDLEMLP